MRYVELLGRVLFSLIFITGSFQLFTANGMAMAAEKGVIAPNILVPFAGLMILSGGLGIFLGCRTKLCAWLIVLFLVPVTLVMHAYWLEHDAATRLMQQVNFIKNIAMLGGAFVITYFGAGPISIDARRSPRQPTLAGMPLGPGRRDEMESAGYPKAA